MLLEICTLVAGAYLLLKGAEWVTDSSVHVANRFGTTNLAVGLILVSILLSLPELLVSTLAFAKGHEQVSAGVALGSVIVNLGLILGLVAIIRPIRIPRHLITRDGIFMLVATIVVSLLAFDDSLISRSDGLVFLLLFIPYAANVYTQEKLLAEKERKKEIKSISKTLVLFGKLRDPLVIRSGIYIFVIGGALLLLGSEFFARGLIDLARISGVSEALIGVTLGALGTSLPNLAVALQATRKGFDELAVSQSIGSNIFTLFVTLGLLGIMKPIVMANGFATVTAPALLAVTVVSFIFLLRGRLGKTEGAVLVLLYLLAVAAEILS
ncbi:MAG: sodium:calcium antiporter [Candidatus Micrarchaeota archaeon]|nr:sodium:calcium antiporter [Candidatus Micrarchaeota archaeon]